jgi:hypothetical protein
MDQLAPHVVAPRHRHERSGHFDRVSLAVEGALAALAERPEEDP